MNHKGQGLKDGDLEANDDYKDNVQANQGNFLKDMLGFRKEPQPEGDYETTRKLTSHFGPQAQDNSLIVDDEKVYQSRGSKSKSLYAKHQ